MITRDFSPANINRALFEIQEEKIKLENGKIIKGYKAITEVESGQVLGIATDKYNTVTNKQAVEWADHVIKEIFKGSSLNDFTCFNVHMPKSKGSCRIDLLLTEQAKTMFGQEKEKWQPFIRISNSYNKKLKLSYKIGFCRSICLNGVIFNELSISFSMSHDERMTEKNIIKQSKEAAKHIGEIKHIWKKFEEKMNILKSIEIKKDLAIPIFCSVFNINIEEKDYKDEVKPSLAAKAAQITTVTGEYFDELGYNAYAMMNILTDIASFPEWIQTSTYNHVYQTKVGKWIDQITSLAKTDKHYILGTLKEEDFKNAEIMKEIAKKENANVRL